ncbi:group 3 secretory phospholipase A2 [Arapaima gigas]
MAVTPHLKNQREGLSSMQLTASCKHPCNSTGAVKQDTGERGASLEEYGGKTIGRILGFCDNVQVKSYGSVAPNRELINMSQQEMPWDSEEEKIFPEEKKYGLHDAGANILCCDCVHRFARGLKCLKEPSSKQALLWDLVSLSCFSFKDCPRRTSHQCPAFRFRVEELQLSIKGKNDSWGREALKIQLKKSRHTKHGRAMQPDA